MTRRERAIEAAARTAWVTSLRPRNEQEKADFELAWDRSSQSEKSLRSRGFDKIVDAVLAVLDEERSRR